MNVFVDVDMRSKKGSQHVIDMLREFAAQSAEWTFDECKSSDYSANLLNLPACILLLEGNKWSPGYAVCEEKPGHCSLVNVVQKKLGRSHVTNTIGSLGYCLIISVNGVVTTRRGLALSISKTDLELEDIITAAIPRKLFQTLLSNHPLSYHPLDVGRLDRFICAFSRYSRKKVNWEYLGQYLKEKKNWPEPNAEWCLNRIDTGLQIIHEYRRYH